MGLNVPSGAIMISESTLCPTGWTNISTQGTNNGCFLRVGTPVLSGGFVVQAGGSDTHTHTYTSFSVSSSDSLPGNIINGLGFEPYFTNCQPCTSVRGGCPSYFSTSEYPINCYTRSWSALDSDINGHGHQFPHNVSDSAIAPYPTPLPPYITVNLCQKN